jgi:HK97 family phage major capsid protein
MDIDIKKELEGIKDANIEKVKELIQSETEKLEEKRGKIGDEIDAKLEKFSKEQLGEEFKKSLYGDLEQKMGSYAEMQKQIDAIDQKIKEGRYGGHTKSFRDELKKELHESEGLKEFIGASKKGASFGFDVKASLVTDSNASGDVVAAQRVAGIKYDPTRRVRMRDIVNVGGSTVSNHIRHVQETSYTNNAAVKSEASAFGQSEFKLDSIDTNAETLGTYVKMSKEMFDDLSIAASYISMRVPEKVLNVEDTQILTGSGSAPNIQGLAASGGLSAYAADADASANSGFRNFFLPANYGFDASGSVNEFDVLATACYQLSKNEYQATAIVVHPFHWYALALRKGTDLVYVREGIMTIMGVPVIRNTAMALGSFLVADFNQCAQLFFRQGIGIEFSYSDQDDFIKNMVTVRASERVMMPIYLTNAGCFGTFAAAKTALK